jgi:hypothetical protein
LPPPEQGVGAQRIEPSDQSDVAALLPHGKRGPERPPRLGGVAAGCDGFFDVRLELFVDLAAQPIAAKYISDARPQRHI